MKTAEPYHDLRAAFARGSEGWIYVESTMNSAVQKLLLHTLAIARTRSDIVKIPVDLKDRPATLMLPKIGSESFLTGQWVRVLQGPYRNDVGLVAEVKSSSVRVLLAPRLQSQGGKQTTQGKRKRGTPRPSPGLFNNFHFEASGRFTLKQTGPSSYQYGTLSFEHGLLVQAFGYQSISSNRIRIPYSLASLFQAANHPKINSSTLPIPQEWSFQAGERVEFISGIYEKSKGVIRTVGYDSLEVDRLEIEEGKEIEVGLVSVPWRGVLKEFLPGSFINVLEGPEKGRSGWVVGNSGKELRCIALTQEASLPALER